MVALLGVDQIWGCSKLSVLISEVLSIPIFIPCQMSMTCNLHIGVSGIMRRPVILLLEWYGGVKG